MDDLKLNKVSVMLILYPVQGIVELLSEEIGKNLSY